MTSIDIESPSGSAIPHPHAIISPIVNAASRPGSDILSTRRPCYGMHSIDMFTVGEYGTFRVDIPDLHGIILASRSNMQAIRRQYVPNQNDCGMYRPVRQ